MKPHRVRCAAIVLALGWLSVLPSFAFAQAKDGRVQRAQESFAKGMEAYRKGQLSLAVSHLQKAYKLVPGPELAYNLGRVYERMADPQKAAEYFHLYLELSQGKVSAKEREDIERRIAALKSVQQRHREQALAALPSENELTSEARRFFLSGVKFFKKNQYEAALQAFTAAYRLSPLAEVAFNLAVLCERLQRREEATDYYREYLRMKPQASDRAQVEAKIRQLKSGG